MSLSGEEEGASYPKRPIGAAFPATHVRSNRGNLIAKETFEPPLAEPIVGASLDEWVEARRRKAFYTAPGSPAKSSDLQLASQVRVAMICDDFTFGCFRHEFQVTRLHPSVWRQQMEKERPAVFFCESAWRGSSPEKHYWQGKIYASTRWPEENRIELLEILEYCHRNGVPTVFWNKEDPTHFSDRVNDFVRTAALFDFVLTTAEECVDLYRRDAGVLQCGVLEFANQPRIFNPMGTGVRRGGASFAGSWYARYADRCESAREIFGAVVEAGLDLAIYDRNFGTKNVAYQYPAGFQRFLHPAVSYEETADIYRNYRFGITLNTVTDSPTMFARRAFELAGTGTVILSNHSQGLEKKFGDFVIYPGDDPDALVTATPSDLDTLRLGAFDIAMNNTYEHRAEQVLDAVGIDFESRKQVRDVLVFVSDPDEARRVRDELFAKRELMNHSVLCVTRDVEPFRYAEFLELQTPQVYVVYEEAISEGLRTKNFLYSDDVFVAASPAELSEKSLDLLMECRQFTEMPLSFAKSKEERLSAVSRHALEGCLIRSNQISQLVGEGETFECFAI